MAPSLNYLLAATTAIILLSTAGTATARLHHVVSKHAVSPCLKASHPKLCEGLIVPGKLNTQYDLALATIKTSIDRANSGAAAAKMLRDEAGSDAIRKSYLDSCSSTYQQAVADLTTAQGYLTGSGTEQDVNINLSAALTDVDTCKSEWTESGIKNFPLDNVHRNLFNLVGNALALCDGVKG